MLNLIGKLNNFFKNNDSTSSTAEDINNLLKRLNKQRDVIRKNLENHRDYPSKRSIKLELKILNKEIEKVLEFKNSI